MTTEPQSDTIRSETIRPETLAGTAPAEAAAPEAAKPSRSPTSIRHARERIVLMCMGLVTAATAAALYVVYEFSLGSAVLGACGVWAALMTIHLQLKKDGEIKRLKAELHRFERNAAGLGAGPARHMPQRPLPMATATMEAPVAAPPMGGPAPQQHAHAPATSGPAGAEAKVAPEEDAGSEEETPASLRLDPSPRWIAPAAPLRSQSQPKTHKPEPAAPAAVPDHKKPQQPAADTALWPGTEVSPSDPMRDQWAFRPRQDIEPANAAAPGALKAVSIEADLEMVQRKIKALADEVNAADAARERERQATDDEKAVASEPGADGKKPAQRSSMIEQSIGALKSAANSMRAKAEPDAKTSDAAPTPAAAMSAGDQPFSFDLLIPKTAQTIAASKPAAGSSPPPPLPEFDLPPLPAIDSPPPVNPRIAAIAEALQQGEMDVYLSPIVALQNHEVSHYDVTVRLKSRSGSHLDDAEQELRLAGSDLLALFDTARLNRAAALARKLEAHNKKGSLLSAVNGPSMTNAEFLDAFARVFEERDRISNQLVLTFSQADIEQFSPSAWRALGDMHAFGFRFALSKIDHAGMDFAALAKRGFAFLRLDANALLNGLPARDRFMGADELCRHLAGAGMTLVADTIDDESVRARIFGFGILFGQGRLFGGARQIKLDPIPSSSPAAA